MTKNEAIEWLKLERKARSEISKGEGILPALDMAIESLSAEPNCEKCAIKELWEETEKEDLVEVVRCKDCIWRNEHCGMGEHKWCEKMNLSTAPNDFCSYGERREP